MRVLIIAKYFPAGGAADRVKVHYFLLLQLIAVHNFSGNGKKRFTCSNRPLVCLFVSRNTSPLLGIVIMHLPLHSFHSFISIPVLSAFPSVSISTILFFALPEGPILSG